MSPSDSNVPQDTQAEPTIDFVCNICGRPNHTQVSNLGRETGSCQHCGSTVRTRAVVYMIARELFGLDIVLPDFPVLRGIAAIGISDSPDYAEPLAAKFSYRNTFYHREPSFDIVHVPESLYGTCDFLIASEVFEHIAPPVDLAFRNAFRLLKPNGLFFFTVPYTLDERSTEHFSDLYDSGIAELRGRSVLVNRTRSGKLQVFEDLVFHGGGGDTLEIRRFTERDIRGYFEKAGFREVEIYGGSYEQFGILRTEDWSLPMVARKEPFMADRGCLTDLVDRSRRLNTELERLQQDHDRSMAASSAKIAELESGFNARTQWALQLEAQLVERTDWALKLSHEVERHQEIARTLQAETRMQRAELEAEIARLQSDSARWHSEAGALQARVAKIYSSPWTRLGRKLGLFRD